MKTPLISNLNILENIALIKEVHEHLETSVAQEEALAYLQKIELSYLAKFRVSQCNEVEIFLIMIIRALMTKEKTVIILRVFSITNHLINIKTIIDNIQIINNNKKILLLDLHVNESDYKEDRCNTIK